VTHDSNPQAVPAAPHPGAGWIRPLHGGGHPPDAPGDDGLVHLAGIVLGALAVVTLATGAALVGLAAYGLITWRRTRWWPPVLLGLAAAMVAIAAVGGPGQAIHHHLTAVREVTGPHPAGLAALIAQRLPAWLFWQLPLGLPVGLIAAGLARHRVTHLPAHELSPSAKARRAAEEQAQLRRAQKRAASAPLEIHGRTVLGAWVSGDLPEWRAGEWCTIPAVVLGLGTVVLGLPGAGKTETLLRPAELGFAAGYDVHIIDAKGDPATQTRFAAIAQGAGHGAKLFPQEPYDGWRGDPTALRNRLGRIVDYTEPYYQDGARVLLDAATHDGATGLDQLLGALSETECDVDNQVRKGTLSRYRSFSAAAGQHLSGTWAFEDTSASYVLLDGVALGDDTPRLARYLLEDFQHYASSRKSSHRRALLIVDEFSALRVSGAAALLERLRSFGVGVIIASQSIEGLHDDPGERARLLGAATTLIAHRLADPEPVCTRAGTRQRAERSHQLDQLGATGMGSLRIQETYRIDPNDLRNLPPGVAWITTAGRAAKVCVTRGGQDRTGGGQAPVSPHEDRRSPRGPQIPATPQRDPERDKRVGRGDPGLHPNETGGFAGDPGLGRRTRVGEQRELRSEFGGVGVHGPHEISFVEAVLVPAGRACDPESAAGRGFSTSTVTAPTFEQQTLPIDRTETAHGQDNDGRLYRESNERTQDPEPPADPEPPPSPYAKRL
jgi:hypothetical protein